MQTRARQIGRPILQTIGAVDPLGRGKHREDANRRMTKKNAKEMRARAKRVIYVVLVASKVYAFRDFRTGWRAGNLRGRGVICKNLRR